MKSRKSLVYPPKPQLFSMIGFVVVEMARSCWESSRRATKWIFYTLSRKTGMDEPNHAFMLRQAGQFHLVFCGNHRTEKWNASAGNEFFLLMKCFCRKWKMFIPPPPPPPSSSRCLKMSLSSSVCMYVGLCPSLCVSAMSKVNEHFHELFVSKHYNLLFASDTWSPVVVAKGEIIIMPLVYNHTINAELVSCVARGKSIDGCIN